MRSLSSSRRQRGIGGAGGGGRGGGTASSLSSVAPTNRSLALSSSSEQSSSTLSAAANPLGKAADHHHGGAKPKKWFPSWRRLRKCLLPPYSLVEPPPPPRAAQQQQEHPSVDGVPSDASSSVPTRRVPSCESDGGSSSSSSAGHHDDLLDHHEDGSRRNPNNLVASPMSLASSSSSSSWSASPPPPPPPPQLSLGIDANLATSLAHPLSDEETRGAKKLTSEDDEDDSLSPRAERRDAQSSEAGRNSSSSEERPDCGEPLAAPPTSNEALEPKAVSFHEKPAQSEQKSGAVPTVPEAEDSLAASKPAATSTTKPGPVRRTFTEAPASATNKLSSKPTPTTPVDSLIAPDLKSPAPAPSSRNEASDLSSPGGAEPRMLSGRPNMVRRGCSVPVMGATPPPSAKQPLSPTSARLSLLPPKAPLTSSGGAASSRPSIVARRISSTATGGPHGGGGATRPRLGSSGGESNLTSSSRHRRSNNSFEFSVDSLQMIREPDSDDVAPRGGGREGGSAAAATDARTRQVSENSWSTMPVATIQIGSLERDCSELVSDDFWEVDSLVMSSDGDDEDNDPEGASRVGTGHPDSGYDTAEDSYQEDASTSDKDNGMSPSPTSVMDDVESRGKHAQEGDGLPDWMLQWAQQPASPSRQGDAAQQDQADPKPTVVEEPTYLPSGPKPEGCVFSTYVAVSMSVPHDGETPKEEVRLVQVMSGRIVVEGKWEIELDRDTRIQPICEEDHPHRAVLVKHSDKEWRLNPVPVIATRGGGFRLASLKSQSRGPSEGWDDATHYEADWSVGPSPVKDNDSQQCEAALHLVFLLDAIRRQGQAQSLQ